MKEEFPCVRTFDPTQHDRAAVRFDRFGDGMGRHFDPVNGDGSWLHARTVPAVSSAYREPLPPDVLRRRAAWIKRWWPDSGLLAAVGGQLPVGLGGVEREATRLVLLEAVASPCFAELRRLREKNVHGRERQRPQFRR